MTDQDLTRTSAATGDSGDSAGNSRPGRDLDPLNLAPHSVEAEEAVLGSILMNPEALHEVRVFLAAEDFFILRHGWIYEAILRLAERDDAIDSRTLAEELRALGRLEDVGGEAYLNYLPTTMPTALNAEVYAHIVERAAIRRRLLGAAGEIARLAHDQERDINEVIDTSESTLFTVTEQRLRQELVPMQIAVSRYFDRIEELRESETEALGVPTGFYDLDKLLGGLQKSDLIIIAGRPGMGKCVAEGTLVATERGLLPIEMLKPEGVMGLRDDEGGLYYPLEIGVQTPEGLRSTSHFYDSGIKPTKRLTTRAGYSLTGTFVHPVLVLNSEGQKVWKRLQDVQVGDYVAVQRHAPVSEPSAGMSWHLDTTRRDTSRRYRNHPPRSGGSRTTVAPSMSACLLWDEVKSIEDAGLQHCYDLTVPDGHAFVANGIVSHNTSFMLSLAMNAARHGDARIAIFSMEMSNEQLVQRMISTETGISSQDLRLGRVGDEAWARFVEATGSMSNLRIYLDDSPAVSAMQLRTKCRRLYREHGLDLIIVDYLQLMNAGRSLGRDTNRVQEITYISRALKELARELNVPLLSAAQLSRAVEQRQDKRPQLSDLRESGSIEQDADIVMFLYRDEIYNEATEHPGEAEVIVAKHRNGPTGHITLLFRKELTKFVNIRKQNLNLKDY